MVATAAFAGKGLLLYRLLPDVWINTDLFCFAEETRLWTKSRSFTDTQITNDAIINTIINNFINTFINSIINSFVKVWVLSLVVGAALLSIAWVGVMSSATMAAEVQKHEAAKDAEWQKFQVAKEVEWRVINEVEEDINLVQKAERQKSRAQQKLAKLGSERRLAKDLAWKKAWQDFAKAKDDEWIKLTEATKDDFQSANLESLVELAHASLMAKGDFVAAWD